MTSPDRAGTARPAVLDQPRSSARVFVSGHSLVDRPVPDYIEQIAQSLGTPMQWERQYVVGSSIEKRTRGIPVADWSGYRHGYNREGENMDVIAELHSPRRVDGPYDALLITEEHVLLDRLFTSDPVRLLRHYHDHLIANNANATTYFYEPWFDVDDKADPQRWIAYERAASKIWQCMATRINASLELEGKPGRVVSIPASTALVSLIERAIQPQGLPSVSQPTVVATVNSIVKDTVHLQPLGNYYIALVSYASIYQRSPVGAWKPDDVASELAQALQPFAAQFVADYYKHYRPQSLGECRQALLDGELKNLWGYISKGYWQKDVNALHAYVRLQRRVWSARKALDARDARNPFYFDAANDAGYWLPLK